MPLPPQAPSALTPSLPGVPAPTGATALAGAMPLDAATAAPADADPLALTPATPPAAAFLSPHPRIIGLGPQVPRRGNAFSQWLGLLMLRLLGGWRITGHWPDVPKAMVIVAPHTSNMDGVLSVVAMMALRLRLSFFMKHSAFPWPFAGLLRWLGAVPVNRGAAHDLVAASAQQFASHEQLLVAITPDGTRHAPKQWKKGFYLIAHRARVPILCIGYDYAKREIVILEALMPSGDFDADLPRLLEQFRGISPRHPERLSRPLRELRDRPR